MLNGAGREARTKLTIYKRGVPGKYPDSESKQVAVRVALGI